MHELATSLQLLQISIYAICLLCTHTQQIKYPLRRIRFNIEISALMQ